MRGTVAKRLRRAAERFTVGYPSKAYEVKHVKTSLKNTDKILPDGKPEVIKVESFQLSLEKTCTRAIYQQLKKGYLLNSKR